MTTETVVKVGEYEVSHTCGSNFVARRNGELWRDLTGDNLVLALVQRIEQLEQAFTTPTPEMVQAGLAEVQQFIDDAADEGLDMTDLPDANASDLAVFVLQAMAAKLPKAGE